MRIWLVVKGFIKFILKKAGVFRLLRVWRRYRFGKSYISRNNEMLRKWIWKDTEESNFYYELDPLNEMHLVHLLSYIFDVPTESVQGYIDELKQDKELHRFIHATLQEKFGPSDIEVHYGRRICWYVIARIRKPAIVVETGIHHGVGGLVLCKALRLNLSEGFTGKYIGTEINPEFGFLITKEQPPFAEIRYGDSLKTLTKMNQKIDLFISDSDHDHAYEYDEYSTINRLLTKDAIIIGDNSHASDSLPRFSKENARHFVFFDEWSNNHWYPGAGVGISLARK